MSAGSGVGNAPGGGLHRVDREARSPICAPCASTSALHSEPRHQGSNRPDWLHEIKYDGMPDRAAGRRTGAVVHTGQTASR